MKERPSESKPESKEVPRSSFVKETDTYFVKEESKKSEPVFERKSEPNKLEETVKRWREESEKSKELKASKIPKSKGKTMKFSGICAFCGSKIGGEVVSKKGTLLQFDPERLETVKYLPVKTLDLPFECSWCGKLFCQDHRLPEQHDCERLDKKTRRQLNG